MRMQTGPRGAEPSTVVEGPSTGAHGRRRGLGAPRRAPPGGGAAHRPGPGPSGPPSSRREDPIHDRDEAALGRRLEADPFDAEAWLALARGARRSGRLPPFLDRARHLEWLLLAWRTTPRERELAVLVLPLLGLRPPRPGGPRLHRGRAWEGTPHLAGEEAAPYDRRSGLPLHVERVVDGAPMVLVPGPRADRTRAWTARRHEEDGMASPEVFWIDRRPVQVARWAAFMAEGRGAEPRGWPAQRQDSRSPVVGVTRTQARQYARWAGGHLPWEVQWRQAATAPGHTPRATAPVIGPARDPSPWGADGMFGGVDEWCLDTPGGRLMAVRALPGPAPGSAGVGHYVRRDLGDADEATGFRVVVTVSPQLLEGR